MMSAAEVAVLAAEALVLVRAEAVQPRMTCRRILAHTLMIAVAAAALTRTRFHTAQAAATAARILSLSTGAADRTDSGLAAAATAWQSSNP
jgi:hypothetical protein